MQNNCDHPQSDLQDHPCGDRILRICTGCMQELDAQYWRLTDDFGLSLEQINRVLVQPRTHPEWIERNTTESAVAVVGDFERKSEGVAARRNRSRRNRLMLTVADKTFLRACGIASEG